MAAFVFMLLILLYMLQINLLPAYFQQQILEHVQETRPRINGIIEDMEANIAYEDQLSRLRQSSADYNVCAYVYDDDAILRLEINSMGSLCYLNSIINPSLESYVQSSTLMGYYIDMVTHQESSEIYFQVQPNADVARQLFLGYEFIVDGQRFYGFINTPYELVDSTITILRDQFFYISVIVFVLAMLVALIISRGLSMPLVRMSQQALRLGKGDKDIAFEGGSIREVDHLAQALNYATDEMQKNDNLRIDLLANMSHDIRTPLTMISAYAQLIDEIAFEDPEKRKQYLDIIISEVDQLDRLLQDMMTLSQLQKSTVRQEISTFDVVDVIDRVIEGFDALAYTSGVQFNFMAQGPLMVEADLVKFRQVVTNYVSNAFKHVGEDKLVLIRAFMIDELGMIRIEVEDHGSGIAPDELELIWDRYYKADKHFTRNKEGTGLGLAISKAICEQLDWPYGVISEENKGSTFYVELPKGRQK